MSVARTITLTTFSVINNIQKMKIILLSNKTFATDLNRHLPWPVGSTIPIVLRHTSELYSGLKMRTCQHVIN